MPVWRVIAAIGMLAVLGGCADTPTGQPDPATSDPTSETTAETTTETTTEPQPEPTDPESAQPTRKQPSLRIAEAPIGPGLEVNQPADDAKQCIGVSLTGLELRNGTTLEFGSPGLAQDEEVFRIDRSACGDQGPSCSGYRFRSDGTPGCYVGVRQVTKDGGQHATLVIPAVATCATEQDCQSLKGKEGSQIGFDSRDLGSTEPTDSPSTEPTESPAESPAETPSGDG